MKILNTLYYTNLHQNANNQNSRYPNLKPLACDTVSFSAMKKKEFEGFDRAVIEKYKAPINSFNSHEDFNTWATNKAKEIREKTYQARHFVTSEQRKQTIDEWAKYIFEENDAYTPAIQLIILDSITKKLNRDNDLVPPLLNKGVLADCISELEQKLKENPKAGFDFNKSYTAKLNAFYLDNGEQETGENGTKWVVIPSKKNDPENFDANVEKLKTLSYKTWCTKSYNAESYLRQGDFHIYLENGKPKIGIRFAFSRVEEIQGEQNNGEVPHAYYDIVDDYIKSNDMELSSKATGEMETAERTKKILAEIKENLSEAIKNNDSEKIFNFFKIKTQRTPEGKLIISEYHQPRESFTFSDVGINEDELFKDVVAIDGNADFENSQLTDLQNIEVIKGWTSFTNSKIKSLGKLKSIYRYANFENSLITNLGELESIGGKATFTNSQVEQLGKLKSIKGDADFSNSKITHLENLKEILGSAFFKDSEVIDLGELETIGGNAFFNRSKVTSLGKLKIIGEDAHFNDSQICDLGDLSDIGRYVDYKNSPLSEDDFKNIRIGEYTK